MESGEAVPVALMDRLVDAIAGHVESGGSAEVMFLEEPRAQYMLVIGVRPVGSASTRPQSETIP